MAPSSVHHSPVIHQSFTRHLSVICPSLVTHLLVIFPRRLSVLLPRFPTIHLLSTIICQTFVRRFSILHPPRLHYSIFASLIRLHSVICPSFVLISSLTYSSFTSQSSDLHLFIIYSSLSIRITSHSSVIRALAIRHL